MGTVKYIAAALDFVYGIVFKANENGQTILPLAMDFCIAFGKPAKIEDKVEADGFGGDISDDEDEENDDLDEKEIGYVDIIGDIKPKLLKNGLKYIKNSRVQNEEIRSRSIHQLFGEFKKNQIDEDDEKEFNAYPHHKRFITLIDRRHKTGQDDDIWFYEPPKNCRTIPSKPLPEWYLNASRTCLLPNMEYGDGKAAERGRDESDSKDNGNTKEELKKSNVTASFHCKGQLMTLSIIASETDSIKAYLFFNGSIIRFFPEDIKTVLPLIFNMKWNNSQKLDPKKGELSENEAFLQKDDVIDGCVKEMKKVLIDKHFANFQQSYTSK